MRFVTYGASATRAANIDWDAPVEVTEELLAAIAPNEPAGMRVGVLRRGFSVDNVLHTKGSIAVTWFRGSEMLLELAASDVAEPEPEPDDDEELVVPWSVEVGAGGAQHHRIVIDEAHADGRLDAVIASVVAELSRVGAHRLIEDGHVALAGKPITKPGHRLRTGDVVEIAVPAPVALDVVAEAIPLTILYEDADLIAIDKPAGLVVHPAPGHPRGTLVNALLHHCKDLSGIGGALRPGIVHRLDKDTSGVIVVTKSDRAHLAISAAFAAKSRGEAGGVHREYLAITSPAPRLPQGTLRTYYGRHPHDRKRFSSNVITGKRAVTHWSVIEAFAGAALVRFRLETGRTHQIRVHAADQRWPLLGDPLYGRDPADPALAAIAATLGRQALHAAILELDHPTTGERMRFEAPLPADLVAALAALPALRHPPTRSST